MRWYNLSGGGSQTETRQYNALGQLTRLTIPGQLDRGYSFSATNNDGKATFQKDYITGEELEYQYDSLGRLTKAETTVNSGSAPQWGLGWVYDGFGNRLQQNAIKGTVPTQSILVDPATNRVQSHTFDANGNTTNTPAQGTMTFDESDRLKTVASDTYAYTPVNQRLWKNNDYVLWGAGGERLVTAQVAMIGSDLRFTQTSFDSYSHGRRLQVSDRLGSVGNYYPFGDAKSGTVSNADSFATYYRDSTALDYAQQRYYQPASGRFLTTDPAQSSAKSTMPTSWNRYDYAFNDPANMTDSTGLDPAAPLEPVACSYLGATGYWCRVTHVTGFGTFTGVGVLSTNLSTAQASAISDVTLKTVSGAANSIAEYLSPSCLTYLAGTDLGDFYKLGQKFLVTDDAGKITVNVGASVSKKISSSIAFRDGPSSPDPFVRAEFQKPGLYTRAYTPFTESAIYWNPGAIISPVEGISSDSWVLGNVLHEVLHLFGLEDYQLQDVFGVARSNATDNITEALARQCFN